MFSLDLVSLLFLLFLSAFTGFLVSLTDFLVDEKHRVRLAYAPALFYSVSAIVLVLSNYALATIFLAMLAGVFFAGKINVGPHRAAVLITLVFVLAKQPVFNAPYLLLFSTACFADEWVHERKWKNHLIKKIAEKRLLLEFTAFLVSVYSGEWLYFTGVLSFDAGYLTALYFLKKQSK